MGATAIYEILILKSGFNYRFLEVGDVALMKLGAKWNPDIEVKQILKLTSYLPYSWWMNAFWIDCQW